MNFFLPGDDTAGAVRPSVVPAGQEEPDESDGEGAAAQGGLAAQLQELLRVLHEVPVSGVRISVSNTLLD